jgi:hypothetical protein
MSADWLISLPGPGPRVFLAGHVSIVVDAGLVSWSASGRVMMDDHPELLTDHLGLTLEVRALSRDGRFVVGKALLLSYEDDYAQVHLEGTGPLYDVYDEVPGADATPAVG